MNDFITIYLRSHNLGSQFSDYRSSLWSRSLSIFTSSDVSGSEIFESVIASEKVPRNKCQLSIFDTALSLR
jgi:hypothetical protein